jgi:glucose/arabinose dehydrogenase
LEPRTTHLRLADLPKPFASQSASKSPNVIARPPGAPLRVPEGFRVQIFADGLDKPRWLALAGDGAVLVTETRQNRIRRLHDANGDGRAEEVSTFATSDNGVDIPFGMAFSAEHFFLGNSDEVRRYRVRPGQASLEGEGERIAELPGGGYNQHWTRNVIVDAANDRLFVSVGSASNVSEEDPPRASVLTMGFDGSGARVFASGLRNPVGLALQPGTGALFATVNERDELGDDLVPDYLAEVVDGAFYGWPYAYLAPELLDPRRMIGDVSTRPDLVARTRTPEVLFQAHSASLGVTFYPHRAFPERYRAGAFACFRGSWNRTAGTGYKLVYIPFEAGRPTGAYEDFLTGFLVDPAGPTTWGRPVGILSMPDGSLLFTEEMNGVVYRVSFEG